MDERLEKVKNGFVNLSDEEKKKFIKFINWYLKKDDKDKEKIREQLEKHASLDLGPLGIGRCPCCGK